MINMMQNEFETKNFIITDLGEIEYNETGDCCNEYMVHIKSLDCLDILFQFDGDKLVCLCAMDQNNRTIEGKELTDFTYKIAKLIENDVIDIVKFMNKHLY